VIGRVTETGRLVLRMHGEAAAEIPVGPLVTEAPLYRRPYTRRATPPEIDPATLPDRDPLDCLRRLVASPDLASKRWIWEQYDHLVQGNTVKRPGGDAAVIRISDTGKALALKTDATPRYCRADPARGGMQAVAESWRNLTAVGALPLALTDNMNFGNPEKPDIMGEFVGVIEGMRAACEALDYPVVSGNVSLYNETSGSAILPTPVIGGVGLIADATKASGKGQLVTLDFTPEDQFPTALRGPVFAAQKEHRNFRSVLRREPDLDVVIPRRVKGNASFCPGNRLAFLWGVAINGNRICKRFCFEKCFIAFRRTWDEADTLVRTGGNLARLGSGQIKSRNLGRGLLNVGDKERIGGNTPLINLTITFGDQINPFRIASNPQAQLHDSQVGRIAIGNGKNSVAHEQRTESEIRVGHDAGRGFFVFEAFEVKVHSRLIQKPIDEKSQALRIAN